MKIHFAVPGFSKCGTTSFCRMLGQHSKVFVPEIKEHNYFSYNHEKGWGWFKKHYKDAKEHQLCTDGSTPYSSLEFAKISCERMLENNPEMKFIFIARNPIKRIESSYRQFHHMGHRFGPTAVAEYDIGQCVRNKPNIINDTRYWEVINIYRERVPDSRIHVIFQENLKSDPYTEVKKTFEFLGLEPNMENINVNQKLNSANDKLMDRRVYRFVSQWWITSDLVVKKLGLKPNAPMTQKLGLRIPFNQKIEWKPEDMDFVFDALLEDSLNFLEFYGQSPEIWNLESYATGARLKKSA